MPDLRDDIEAFQITPRFTGWSPSTRRTYRNGLLMYERFLADRDRLDDQTASDVVAFVHKLQGEGSPRTAAARLSAIRAFHGWRVRSKRASFDPTASIAAVKVKRQALHIVHPRVEIKLVRSGMANISQRGMFALMYDCVMGLEDTARLRVSDIDIVRWEVTTRRGAEVAAITPIIGQTARLTLRELHLSQGGSGWAFPSPHAGRGHLHCASLARHVAEGALRANVMTPDWSPVTLRHSRIRHLYDDGMPLTVLMRLCGHRFEHETREYLERLGVSASELTKHR